MGIDPTDMVSHRRILAFLTGGLIPFISLTFAHMLIVYSSKIQSGNDEVPTEPKILTENELAELSKKAGKMEAETKEEKINPTPEDLDRLEQALQALERKNNIEETVETEEEPQVLTEETTYFVDGEEIKEDGKLQIKRLSYTKNV